MTLKIHALSSDGTGISRTDHGIIFVQGALPGEVVRAEIVARKKDFMIADTREVEKLLLEVVKGHSSVLKEPAPFVIFKNFGDSGLDFEIYYWLELRKSSGLKASSDMRHHIASVFKREGINIPYPQRDIHIISDERRGE